MKTLIAGLLFFMTPAFAGTDTYTVSFLLGTAALRPSGQPAWQPVMLFDRISTGDSLRNDTESRLELVSGDGSMVAINAPWSGVVNRAALAGFTTGNDNRSILKKLTTVRDNDISEQPVAIAAVRGKAAGDGTGTPETDGSIETIPPPAATADDAGKLLEEAIQLRARVDKLLQENRREAAASALQLAEKLTLQALAMLGAK